MTNPRYFFLNLTSNIISLGLKQGEVQKVIDSFDPNEPAASAKLKNLYHLAKALNFHRPQVEVNLPENLLQNETLITEKIISNDDAVKILNKREKNDQNSIISFSIENIGTRATSITYIKQSLIEEVKEFIEKAGFKIKKFNIGKFSLDNTGKGTFNFYDYFKAPNFEIFQNYSRLFYISIILLSISFASYFTYTSKNKIVFLEPKIQENLKVKKLNSNILPQNFEISFIENFISLEPPSQFDFITKSKYQN